MVENSFVGFLLILTLILFIQNVACMLLTLLLIFSVWKDRDSGFDLRLFPLFLHLNWVKAKV